jgi:ABC-type dipeptide/oligopeptide/nickel transport system ATPase component
MGVSLQCLVSPSRLDGLALLSRVATEHNSAGLYITHDIASADCFAGTLPVMYASRLLEGGPAEAVAQKPARRYARLSVESAPRPDRTKGSVRDAGGPLRRVCLPKGCRSDSGGPEAMDTSCPEIPSSRDIDQGHWADSWLFGPGNIRAAQ